MSSLSVTELWVKYGRMAAVQGIDLQVEDGEIVALLGPNGAGKSSTLRAISGSVRLAAGSITFDGRDIGRLPAHRIARLGLTLVPEGRRIFAPLSVEQNLIVGGYLQARTRRKELIGEVFEMFPRLAERQALPAGLLSGGEQQMLAFGRALMSEPQMVMLDEPFMGLAPVVVDTIIEAISSIAARGLSILIVEQNARAALDIAQRAYVIEQGRIVLTGPSVTVATDPLVLRAFLGLDESVSRGAMADDQTAPTGQRA
jgi:branched-chain amino acid transport system ATP-binding protein